MRPWRRGATIIMGAALLTGVGALVAVDLPGDPSLFPPRPGAGTVAVFIVSNGFHTGLAVPEPELARVAGLDAHRALLGVTQRFGSYDFLEFGWGEERFYRGTPKFEDVKWWLAFRALFLKNRTVVQVVGLSQPPQIAFAGATMMRIDVSDAGFARIASRIDAAFAPGPDGNPSEVGPGLYGPSLFYRAVGRTSVLNVCNTWIGRLLNAAGLPNSPPLSVTAGGLFADLQFRSGVRLLTPGP